ncbi:hypothetical protein [Acidovorax sp. SUPP1855]|uniref:hypothetical protein n=1 Tax=Acidovorax sp. SUPP1855 TaxID=431774 RepID=UPI0024E093CF|nr:hypothetical protein [Acidovorax sp. SUPP1855]
MPPHVVVLPRQLRRPRPPEVDAALCRGIPEDRSPPGVAEARAVDDACTLLGALMRAGRCNFAMP